MTTLYPMDFHRRVDRRWAERMTLAAADAHGSPAHARLTGQRRNEIWHAREGLDTLSQSDAAQRSQRRRRMATTNESRLSAVSADIESSAVIPGAPE
jgi:hypothetical protein